MRTRKSRGVMLADNAVLLHPYIEPAVPELAGTAFPIPPTDPPIMIPGIEADGTLFPIEKIAAHAHGVHHLAISVFVFSGDEMLIQRRAEGKYHCGGQWANSVCTHPHWGEAADTAAARRLTEELGISLPVTERRVVEYSANVGGGLWEKERVHMFRAEADRATLRPVLDPHEVSETRWVDAATLREDVRRNAAHYTPWFRMYVNRFPDLEF